MAWFLLAVLVLVVAVVAYDLAQRRHAILRNFPILGHFRYLLETVGPELRQYIVTGNDEERPFSRDQRRWIYASAKQQNNYFGFGTDNDLERSANHILIKHAAFPAPERSPGTIGGAPDYQIPAAKVLGGWRGREHAFRPPSIINISGMSFGSLSEHAVEAMNLGAKLAGCLHNTGEGGLTSYHQLGGELVFQVGTGYFGVRDARGHFDLARLVELVEANPVRAIEIKLSQGAKPGHGGLLPARKVTPTIARFRGVEVGRDCISPPGHSAFSDVESLVEFVEQVAGATGLPVGIKTAVGDERFFDELAARMAREQAGPDFLTIDGGEGGTGAAPLVFSDHVALPFKVGMARTYAAFARHDMHERVVFIGAGRLGFPQQALVALALGCDMVNVAREAMIAIGCIQAQRCHTNHCPTGVATQSRWLMRGLDPTSKSARLANYVVTLRKELLEVSRACGAEHPALVAPSSIEIVDEAYGCRPLHEVFDFYPDWGTPTDEDLAGLRAYMHGSGDVEPGRAGTAAPDSVDTRPQTAISDSAAARNRPAPAAAHGGDPAPDPGGPPEGATTRTP